jgi:hypothetical protein
MRQRSWETSWTADTVHTAKYSSLQKKPKMATSRIYRRPHSSLGHDIQQAWVYMKFFICICAYAVSNKKKINVTLKQDLCQHQEMYDDLQQSKVVTDNHFVHNKTETACSINCSRWVNWNLHSIDTEFYMIYSVCCTVLYLLYYCLHTIFLTKYVKSTYTHILTQSWWLLV